jgi:hypothetical protein
MMKIGTSAGRILAKVSLAEQWAPLTAETLRQACLAQESRVSQDAPLLPAVVVVGISVSNSSFLGPVDLELNPQYNALIGGRGTSKSTILEYLRWALCHQPPGFSDEDTPGAPRSNLKASSCIRARLRSRFGASACKHVFALRVSACGHLIALRGAVLGVGKHSLRAR